MIMGIEPLRVPAHLPVWAMIAGLCAVAIGLYPRPRSVGDVDQRRLVHARVRGALAVGLIGTVLLSIDGGVNLFGIVGLWACVLAVPLGLPFLLRRRRKPARKHSRKIEELLGRSEARGQRDAAVGQHHDRPPLGNE
jgi:peptidoglycan/LPS O-acetylase OafA/YrhL